MRASLLVAIVLVALAGCGGGKDAQHKAFASSLNAICRDVNGAIAVIEDEARRIGRLKVPSDQKANVTGALAVLRDQVDAARAMAAAGSSGDTAAIDAINKRINSLHSKGQALTEKMGAKDCSAR
jgi:hypothetical protein